MADVSSEFKSELERRLREAVDVVIAAKSWPETRRLMVARTYPLTVALQRIEEGWSEKDIRNQLHIMLNLGRMVEVGIAGFQPGA